ncbi:MAG: hypothetical protein IJ083_10320 [Clostridia bacterium]|nr:hypothetical protein [Clostridia bacterium]
MSLKYQDLQKEDEKHRYHRPTEKDLENFRTYFLRYYASKKAYSLADTYQIMLEEQYTKEPESPDQMSRPLVENYPPFPAFQYYCMSYGRLKPREVLRRRSRNKDFSQKYDAVLYHMVRGMEGVCQFEGDATVVNVDLVDWETRTKCIGRPTLTLLCAQSAIAGFYLGFQDEKVTTYKAALYMANEEDKESYFADMGVVAHNHAWPTAGMPATIITDNGPLKSELINSVIPHIQLSFLFCPDHEPTGKPYVESRFHVLDCLKIYLRGIIDRQNPSDRHDKTQMPCLTYQELLQILVDWAETMNLFQQIHITWTNDVRAHFTLDPDGFSTTPLGYFRHCLLYRASSLRTLSKIQQIRCLWETENGTFSRKGMKVGHHHYLPDSQEKWEQLVRVNFAPGHLHGSKRPPVTAYYHPACLRHVYTYGPTRDGQEELIRWTMIAEEYDHMLRAPWGEIQYWDRQQKRVERAQKKKEKEGRAGMGTRTRKYVGTGCRLTRQQLRRRGATKVDMKDIAANKAEERNRLEGGIGKEDT